MDQSTYESLSGKANAQKASLVQTHTNAHPTHAHIHRRTYMNTHTHTHGHANALNTKSQLCFFVVLLISDFFIGSLYFFQPRKLKKSNMKKRT
jgi:hypothetical protein